MTETTIEEPQINGNHEEAETAQADEVSDSVNVDLTELRGSKKKKKKGSRKFSKYYLRTAYKGTLLLQKLRACGARKERYLVPPEKCKTFTGKASLVLNEAVQNLVEMVIRNACNICKSQSGKGKSLTEDQVTCALFALENTAFDHKTEYKLMMQKSKSSLMEPSTF